MKKVFFIALWALALLVPYLITPAFAAEEVEKQILPTSPLYLLVKVKEAVQQFLTFSQPSKAELFENFAERRLREMEYANFSEDEDALEVSLNRYQEQKTRALGYVKGASDERIMNQIRERTIQQQRMMTKLQLRTETTERAQQRIVEVQKGVAEETKTAVGDVLGINEADEMDNNVHYVWLDPNADASGNLPPLPDEIIKEWEYAPGTEGRDETGKIVEITYAPGTTAGGEAGNKVEIEWAVETGPPTVVTDQNGDSGSGGGVKKVIIQQGKDVVVE